MADTIESVLCMKQEVFVYRIPARVSNRGYRAADWKLDEPDWTGRLKVICKNKEIFIKLEDKNSGELFALSPIQSYPSDAVEQVLDSSRYFVVRIQDGNGRNAFIGLGFADRADSFDLLVALQDHFKHIKRDEQQVIDTAAELDSPMAAAAKLDLSFKDGQTIKLNFPTKKSGEMDAPKSKTKNTAVAPGAFLPPPPGGSKVIPNISQAPKTLTPNHAPINTGSNLLVNISPPAAKNITAETWNEYDSVTEKTNNLKSTSNGNSWVNFD